jgi:hypothetical protein
MQNGEMFFINTVTGHLWHLIHGAHLMDSNTLNPLIYEKLDTIADHYHYDRSGSWTELPRRQGQQPRRRPRAHRHDDLSGRPMA